MSNLLSDSLSLSKLLDCFVIPVLMILSWWFLKTRYRIVHYVAVCICLLGVGAMVGADLLTQREQGSSKWLSLIHSFFFCTHLLPSTGSRGVSWSWSKRSSVDGRATRWTNCQIIATHDVPYDSLHGSRKHCAPVIVVVVTEAISHVNDPFMHFFCALITLLINHRLSVRILFVCFQSHSRSQINSTNIAAVIISTIS